MVSFLILADGTIVYDEYSTPVRWARVMLVHTIRICWCCVLSYYISELRRGGLWACPQLSSYSWWGCEYNMYRLLTKIYLQLLLGEVDVCKLYYWLARVFRRASRRCSSYNLSLGSLTWFIYALWDALSRWHCFWRVLTPQLCMPIFLDWALQLMYVHNQSMIVISSSSMVATIGTGSGPSKLW